MAPIKDEEAIGRTFMLAIKSPIITSALSLLIGGAGGNYYGNQKQNDKLDEIARSLGEKPVNERLIFLEESMSNVIGRVEKLEGDTVRIPYRRRKT